MTALDDLSTFRGGLGARTAGFSDQQEKGSSDRSEPAQAPDAQLWRDMQEIQREEKALSVLRTRAVNSGSRSRRNASTRS